MLGASLITLSQLQKVLFSYLTMVWKTVNGFLIVLCPPFPMTHSFLWSSSTNPHHIIFQRHINLNPCVILSTATPCGTVMVTTLAHVLWPQQWQNWLVFKQGYQAHFASDTCELQVSYNIYWCDWICISRILHTYRKLHSLACQLSLSLRWSHLFLLGWAWTILLIMNLFNFVYLACCRNVCGGPLILPLLILINSDITLCSVRFTWACHYLWVFQENSVSDPWCTPGWTLSVDGFAPGWQWTIGIYSSSAWLYMLFIDTCPLTCLYCCHVSFLLSILGSAIICPV